ncbi:MAG: uracil phosphoribosyltransferase [Actinomycetales bacterium]
MRVHVADHPLIAHKLTYLRDKDTDSPTFRRLAEELMTLLAYEATRDVRVEPKPIQTPVAPTIGIRLSTPRPIIVPILRAGLGMLEGMVRLLPSAEVGFLGLVRDEHTLEVSTYANRLPESLAGRQAFAIDPMLATGHSLVIAVRYLLAKGADEVTAVCLIAAPEGLAHLEAEIGPDAPLTLVVGAVDERLNENGYIVPGLGDAGDRLYGVVQ